MASLADELAMLPMFQRVPRREMTSAAPLWQAIALSPGERLWEQGEAVDQLAVVLFGELAAVVDGVEVGRVMPGEILGEASAFFAGTTRSAALVSRGSTQVAVLPTPSLRTLRWQRSALYDALLEQGLKSLVRRVRATDQKIACLALGAEKAPVRAEPSAMVRLWKAFRPGGPKSAAPDLLPLLQRQPGLRDADAETLGQIQGAFVAEAVEEGQIVFLEDEPGHAAWIVAEGAVDVLRHVRGDRAELLATLSVGAPFGINTLVEKGPRTASCVAAQAGWLYRLDTEAAAALQGDARLRWRESMLAALATQIRFANASLNRATARTRGPVQAGSGELRDLLDASGFLEGLPTNEETLAAVQFAVTDDHERNRKNRRLR
jgi:CRP-like cAMP-binding protein